MAETNKMQVFTYDNLALYDELLKGEMSAEDAKSLKTVAMVEGTDKYTIKFYKVTEPVGETEPAYQVEIPKTDTSDLITKITNAVAGNVVVSKADGTVEDSGIKASDLATKTEVTSLANGAVKTNTDAIAVLNGDATKEGSVAKAVKDSADTINATIGTVTEGKTVVQMISDAQTAATYDDTQIKADINAMYTNEQIDSAIATAVANADHLKRSIVDTLPEAASADENIIYMVSIADGSGNQKYEEFMLINGAFEKIGDSAVDLTDYATKTEVNTAKSEAQSYADGLASNYDAAGSASTAETNAKTYADGLNTAMDARMDAVEGLVGTGYEPIPEASIRALFAK